MMKSYKFRLYPSKKQRVTLEATLDTCRHLYNNALGCRKLQAELYQLPIEKHRIKVAKVHRRIRQQRMDFHHKLSRKLVNQYDFIAFEDLKIKNMLRNHHLAKSISDVSWNMLQSFTAYKAEWAGKVVTFVNPKNTSQECSSCGKIVKKILNIKIHN
ncbi:MAG TPA: hypothetical protein ENH28_03740, partial [Euryarchaeota archaeon]|nr:hypothetical protein [Euryarchaeota archaeon]